MKEQQLALELEYADRNLTALFEEHREYLTAETVAVIKEYMDTPFNAETRPDLVDVIGELKRKESRLEDTIFSALVFILTKQKVTLQAVVGILFGKYECQTYRRRTVLIDILLQAIVLKCPFITTTRSGDYTYFESKLKLQDHLLHEIDKQGFVLPMLHAPKVTTNKSIGYLTFNEHVISGGKLKEHDKEVCLDHLNRLNSTAYSYEPRLKYLTVPTFNSEPKVKDNGKYETEKDIQDRKVSFQLLHDELPDKHKAMDKHGNKFHIMHKYDNRVRTYAKSHHYNYMGTKWLKAMVTFHDKELTKGAW